MYHLPYFKDLNAGAVIEFMHRHPFIVLTGVDAEQQPVATQVPVLLKEREGLLYLEGHIMRQTDHHKAFENNDHALAIFTGPHAYVSASWYEDKQTASTWNYMTVHAKGNLRFLDHDRLLRLLYELTSHFENDLSSPSLYKELPDEYISRLSRAIIAFEIKVTSIDHVFKLSQNRDEKSFQHIITALQHGDAGAQEIAMEMQKRKDELFR